MATVKYTTINGRVVAEKRGGVRKMYRPDHQGSTIALYDNTQTKTDTITYWPYGEIRSRTGTSVISLLYIGTLGYYADTSSRTYVRARFYRQGLGRWQTVDPLWPNQCSFCYADCNPTSYADPSGLKIDCPEGHPIFAAYSAIVNRMKTVCKTKLAAIQDCWKQAGETDWQKEGECFCKHASGDSDYGIDITCRKPAYCNIFVHDCMGATRGSFHGDCSIDICDEKSLTYCQKPMDYEAALFHEIMHCCGASHEPLNWNCQADPSKLEPCLRLEAGYPPLP